MLVDAIDVCPCRDQNVNNVAVPLVNCSQERRRPLRVGTIYSGFSGDKCLYDPTLLLRHRPQQCRSAIVALVINICPCPRENCDNSVGVPVYCYLK